MTENIVPLERLGMNDVNRVGGKNASLGEMIGKLGDLGVEVPGGFATTADAFNDFLDAAGIRERIHQRLEQLDTDDVRALAAAGEEIRGWIIDAPLPVGLRDDIAAAYAAMAVDGSDATVAVRSSATAEDLPDGGFAGRIVRRAAGNLSQRARHRPGAARDSPGIRLAVQRPRDLLSRAPGFRPR
jgi:pyruvate,water dikinase